MNYYDKYLKYKIWLVYGFFDDINIFKIILIIKILKLELF